jgi:hypothetical protein
VKQTQALSKVFGIGHGKTGTYSLTVALQYLGYSAIHYPTNMRQIEAHDAATDAPVTIIFEKLDALYPGSRFIYTVRDLEEWLESCQRHYLKQQGVTNPFVGKVRKILLGAMGYDRELFIQAYERLDVRVRDYFSDRPDDLLVVDICGKPPAWEPICEFLGKPVPDVGFPWANRTSATEQFLVRLLDVFGDVQRTAQVTGIYPDYLESLSRGGGKRHRGADGQLDWDDGGYNDEIVDRVVSHFGTVEDAAAKLGMPAALLEESVARTAEDRNQRATADGSS